MARRRAREVAGPALVLAGAGIAAGTAVGGVVAHRRRRAAATPSPGPAAVVRALLEEPWRGNPDVIDELVADDYVGHDPAGPEPIRGPAGVRASVERLLAAFPGGAITVDDQVVSRDRVATRWTGRGTHTGELAGIAPTGRDVTVSGVTVSRLERGKVVEEWISWDRLGLLVQLGAIAEPVPG